SWTLLCWHSRPRVVYLVICCKAQSSSRLPPKCRYLRGNKRPNLGRILCCIAKISFQPLTWRRGGPTLKLMLQCSIGRQVMPAVAKFESSRTHSGESSFVTLLSGWMQQGVNSFFATQRILLDLAMRQNASVMHLLRERLADPHHSPAAILTELAGEGMSNFIEAQKVLLNLAQEQNQI